MNALEMALEALTNPSTIAVQHAIELIRAELAKSEMPTKIFGPNLEEILNTAGFYKPEQEAYVYAKRLAEFIWGKHFRKESPDWKPLENTLGVLTQIDNMTCVLEKAKPEQEPVGYFYLRKGVFFHIYEPHNADPEVFPLYTAPHAKNGLG